jgi:hypothetical protein
MFLNIIYCPFYLKRLPVYISKQRFGDCILSLSAEIGTSSIDWAQLSRFLSEDGDRTQSQKRCVMIYKQNGVLNKTGHWIICRNMMFVLMYHRHKLLDLN